MDETCILNTMVIYSKCILNMYYMVLYIWYYMVLHSNICIQNTVIFGNSKLGLKGMIQCHSIFSVEFLGISDPVILPEIDKFYEGRVVLTNPKTISHLNSQHLK